MSAQCRRFSKYNVCARGTERKRTLRLDKTITVQPKPFACEVMDSDGDTYPASPPPAGNRETLAPSPAQATNEARNRKARDFPSRSSRHAHARTTRRRHVNGRAPGPREAPRTRYPARACTRDGDRVRLQRPAARGGACSPSQSCRGESTRGGRLPVGRDIHGRGWMDSWAVENNRLHFFTVSDDW